MKRIIKVLLVFAIIPMCIVAQTTQQRIKDFGFTTREVTALTSAINHSSNIIVDSNEIFYVNSAAQVCYYKNNSGIWAAMGELNASAPTIRTGGKIYKTGDTIYYVGSDSKIYQLENTTGDSWTSTLLVPSQVAVRTDAAFLYSYPYIYYIGADNTICGIFFTGSGWQGGIAIINTINLVRSGSKIIQPADTNLLYYISTSGNICELSLNASSGWSAETIPGCMVKAGTNLETDGTHLYYVNASTNKITDAYWNSAWQTTDLPCLEDIRTDVAPCYSDSTLFFAGAASGKLNILSLKRNGQWLAVPVDATSTTVKTGSAILNYSNVLFEEGSNTRTFNSQNVFYAGSDNTLRYFVYDDIPCTDTYNMLWNTEGCKVAGEFPKDWQFGPDINIEKPASLDPGFEITQNDKNIYFISQDNFIKVMNRTPPDNLPILDTNKRIITFSDEFDSLTVTKAKWNPQFPHGNVHQPDNKSQMDGYNNISCSNGIATIQTKQESNVYQYWRKNAAWGDDCYLQPYDYSSCSLHTGCVNCNSIVSPVPQLINCPGAPTVKEHTFSQKYGWFEMRTRTPPGKGLWNAFWLLPRDEGYTWANEMDVFEVPGNGKYIAQTNWTDFVDTLHPNNGRYSEAKIIDCIGYRTYADYHTYAVNWTSDAITFYFDNKQVGSVFNYYVPTASEMYMLVNNYVNEGSGSNMMIQSEVSNFPNNWDIDYVRVYKSDSTSLQSQQNMAHEYYNIYPNPAHDQLTIGDPAYSHAEIYTVTGEKILETKSTSIDLVNISRGIYFIRITDNGGKTTNFKFIKM